MNLLIFQKVEEQNKEYNHLFYYERLKYYFKLKIKYCIEVMNFDQCYNGWDEAMYVLKYLVKGGNRIFKLKERSSYLSSWTNNFNKLISQNKCSSYLLKYLIIAKLVSNIYSKNSSNAYYQLCQLTTVRDNSFLNENLRINLILKYHLWSFAALRTNSLHRLNDIHTFNYLAEDDMLPVKPLRINILFLLRGATLGDKTFGDPIFGDDDLETAQGKWLRYHGHLFQIIEPLNHVNSKFLLFSIPFSPQR